MISNKTRNEIVRAVFQLCVEILTGSENPSISVFSVAVKLIY